MPITILSSSVRDMVLETYGKGKEYATHLGIRLLSIGRIARRAVSPQIPVSRERTVSRILLQLLFGVRTPFGFDGDQRVAEEDTPFVGRADLFEHRDGRGHPERVASQEKKKKTSTTCGRRRKRNHRIGLVIVTVGVLSL